MTFICLNIDLLIAIFTAEMVQRRPRPQLLPEAPLFYCSDNKELINFGFTHDLLV